MKKTNHNAAFDYAQAAGTVVVVIERWLKERWLSGAETTV